MKTNGRFGAALGRLYSGAVPVALVLVASAQGLGGQQPDGSVLLPVPPVAAPRQEAAVQEVSPRGAFLRALAVPGWGHVAIGEPVRGGFYFITEAAAGWMIVRTVTRLNSAKSMRDLRMAGVQASLAARGIDDPREIITAQNADPLVSDARGLVEARRQQIEDWLSLGLFLVFFSGADAFVSAHLKDFPEPVGLSIRSGPAGFDVGVSLRVGSVSLPR